MYNVILYGSDVLATITNGECLISELMTPVSVGFEATFINPFYEMINEPTERAGGSFDNFRKKRRTFSIETFPQALNNFQTMLSSINGVMDKNHVYFACSDYDAVLHTTGGCIPVEIFSEGFSNVIGLKKYSLELKAKFI